MIEYNGDNRLLGFYEGALGALSLIGDRGHKDAVVKQQDPVTGYLKVEYPSRGHLPNNNTGEFLIARNGSFRASRIMFDTGNNVAITTWTGENKLCSMVSTNKKDHYVSRFVRVVMDSIRPGADSRYFDNLLHTPHSVAFDSKGNLTWVSTGCSMQVDGGDFVEIPVKGYSITNDGNNIKAEVVDLLSPHVIDRGPKALVRFNHSIAEEDMIDMDGNVKRGLSLFEANVEFGSGSFLKISAPLKIDIDSVEDMAFARLGESETRNHMVRLPWVDLNHVLGVKILTTL